MRSLLVLASVAGFGACQANKASDDSAVLDVRSAATDGGRWYVEYVPSPDPIPGNKEFSMDISISEDGAPASDTEIAVFAEMRSHGHGMNQSPVLSGADGEFTATGMLFHMTGKWHIVIDVTDGTTTETAEFVTVCCES